MTRIAIIDLEYTAWEGSLRRDWSEPWEEPEAVQIAGVKLENSDALREVDTLEILVSPRINPELSDYFVELTGITTVDVAQRGVGFPEAFGRFVAFVADCEQGYCFGGDEPLLRRNCALDGIEYPLGPDFLRNAKPMIIDYLGRPPNRIASSQLPEALGFARPGPAHDALSDSRCIAQALRVLRGAGAF